MGRIPTAGREGESEGRLTLLPPQPSPSSPTPCLLFLLLRRAYLVDGLHRCPAALGAQIWAPREVAASSSSCQPGAPRKGCAGFCFALSRRLLSPGRSPGQARTRQSSSGSAPSHHRPSTPEPSRAERAGRRERREEEEGARDAGGSSRGCLLALVWARAGDAAVLCWWRPSLRAAWLLIPAIRRAAHPRLRWRRGWVCKLWESLVWQLAVRPAASLGSRTCSSVRPWQAFVIVNLGIFWWLAAVESYAWYALVGSLGAYSQGILHLRDCAAWL